MRFREDSRPGYCLTIAVAAALFSGCTSATNSDAPAVTSAAPVTVEPSSAAAPHETTSDTSPGLQSAVQGMQTATFGAGCFWCVEAVFEQLKSVENVRSGYTGGTQENASYDLVSGGSTGHAEVIQFEFDPSVITYEELLEVFWTTHDPTTMNQQGADVGTQYRSSVFYHDDKQKELAEAYKQRLNDENAFGSPVVTEIVPFTAFYSAEGYHQDYFSENSSKPYCQRIIRPKVEKVRKVFADKLRK